MYYYINAFFAHKTLAKTFSKKGREDFRKQARSQQFDFIKRSSAW